MYLIPFRTGFCTPLYHVLLTLRQFIFSQVINLIDKQLGLSNISEIAFQLLLIRLFFELYKMFFFPPQPFAEQARGFFTFNMHNSVTYCHNIPMLWILLAYPPSLFRLSLNLENGVPILNQGDFLLSNFGLFRNIDVVFFLVGAFLVSKGAIASITTMVLSQKVILPLLNYFFINAQHQSKRYSI